MPPRRRLTGLRWMTIQVGKGKSKRYMKVATQKGTKRMVVGKPRKKRS